MTDEVTVEAIDMSKVRLAVFITDEGEMTLRGNVRRDTVPSILRTAANYYEAALEGRGESVEEDASTAGDVAGSDSR